jgi:hypothetical protein
MSGQYYQTNGSRLNYSGCKIQAKSMEIICKIKGMKPAENLGKIKANI